MTQEEKELLLKDLCARLPYEVIVKYKSREKEGNVKITSGNIGYVAELGNGWWKECKPYLRPMSSMTDDEKNELWFLLSEGRTNIELDSNGRLITRDNVELGFNYPVVCPQISSEYVDWLNEHYFDYRGLIEKGLALEAPEDMYK